MRLHGSRSCGWPTGTGRAFGREWAGTWARLAPCRSCCAASSAPAEKTLAWNSMDSTGVRNEVGVIEACLSGVLSWSRALPRSLWSFFEHPEFHGLRAGCIVLVSSNQGLFRPPRISGAVFGILLLESIAFTDILCKDMVCHCRLFLHIFASRGPFQWTRHVPRMFSA